MGTRAERLASRIVQGAAELAALGASLTDAEWQTLVPEEGRAVGVLIHHVATMYPLEIDLARELAAGRPITGVTWEAVAELNAAHAAEHAEPSQEATLELLRERSRAAAARVSAFTDAELDGAAPISLNADAPLTAQFFIEDHALRHSFHHLAAIRAALVGEREAKVV